jgi:hypothetical protein
MHCSILSKFEVADLDTEANGERFFMCPIDSAGQITPPADVNGASISAG